MWSQKSELSPDWRRRHGGITCCSALVVQAMILRILNTVTAPLWNYIEQEFPWKCQEKFLDELWKFVRFNLSLKLGLARHGEDSMSADQLCDMTLQEQGFPSDFKRFNVPFGFYLCAVGYQGVPGFV